MNRYLIYVLLLSMLVSCTMEAVPEMSDAGTISVHLISDREGCPGTRTPAELEGVSAETYMIGIYNSDGTKAQYNGENGEIPDIAYGEFGSVKVDLGNSYYVTALSCTAEEAEYGYGCARFEGRSNVFSLNASNISETAEVICYQTNAVVTVIFDDTVDGRFSDLKVVLKSDLNQERILTVSENNEDTDIYFNPSVLSYTISGVFKATESIATTSVNKSGTRILGAKDHIRLIVKVNMDYGLAQVPAIYVDEEIAYSENVESVIDPYEYDEE